MDFYPLDPLITAGHRGLRPLDPPITAEMKFLSTRLLGTVEYIPGRWAQSGWGYDGLDEAPLKQLSVDALCRTMWARFLYNAGGQCNHDSYQEDK